MTGPLPLQRINSVNGSTQSDFLSKSLVGTYLKAALKSISLPTAACACASQVFGQTCFSHYSEGQPTLTD